MTANRTRWFPPERRSGAEWRSAPDLRATVPSACAGDARLASRVWAVVVAWAVVVGCATPAAPPPTGSNTEGRPKPATLVLRGGTVVTVNPARPRAEGVAVRGDRIVAVGTHEDVSRYIGPQTEVVELAGRMAMPGFIEGHGHFLLLGFSRMQLDLNRVKNWDEVVRKVAEAVKSAEPGEWIFGRGWHQSKWNDVPEPSVDGLPVHDALSRVSPNNPVFLGHASDHAAFANAAAMALGGVTEDTPDPPGGQIVRDDRGRPTGAFREEARALVFPGDGVRSEALERKKVRLAAEECLRKGITSFQDAGSSLQDIALFRNLAARDALGVRLWVMLARDIPNETLSEVLPRIKYRDTEHHRLTVGAIKRMIDGALGAHGALLLEPYADLPTSRGLQITPRVELARTAALAREHGFQLCTHAIGDRANRVMLDVYEAALGPRAKQTDHRWRIEHAQHIDPVDVPRFARLGVVASVQAVHCTSDGPWVPDRLGLERAERTSYLWKSLLDSGAVVINGTDAPVEDVDPLKSYYASVTRKMQSGRTFFPSEAMSRAQALRAYTLDAAYAAFEEDIKGSLTVGKLADITVLSKDITRVPADEILTTEVVSTIVGGKVRYSNSPR